jgi:membrane protease YdiL (CAAX protease family)
VAAARAFELPPTPGATDEKAALDTTRRILKRRTETLIVAILFTLLPFTFTFDGDGMSFLLIRDKPVVGAAWLLTAAVLWACYVHIRRRLSVSGL